LRMQLSRTSRIEKGTPEGGEQSLRHWKEVYWHVDGGGGASLRGGDQTYVGNKTGRLLYREGSQ